MSCNYQCWLPDELFCSPRFSQDVSIFRAHTVPSGGGGRGGELPPPSPGSLMGKQLLSCPAPVSPQAM